MLKIIRKVIKIAVIISLLLFVTSKVSSASGRSDVDSIISVGKSVNELSSICSKSNDVVGKKILVYTSGDGLLSFSNKIYGELSTDEKEDFMGKSLMYVKESNLGVQVKSKVYNFIYDQDSSLSASVKYLKSDTSVDFASALSIFKPFGSFLGTVIGVVVLIICSFMMLSIVIDLAYLNIPLIEATLNRGNNDKPVLISESAFKASLEARQKAYEENSTVIYIKNRVPIFLLVSFMVMYLVSGKIYDLLGSFIDLFYNMF